MLGEPGRRALPEHGAVEAATLGAHVASERRWVRTAGCADPARVLALGAGEVDTSPMPFRDWGSGRGVPDRRARAAAQAGARRAPRPRGELDVGAGALAARRRHHRAAPVARPPGAVAPVPRRQGGAGRAAAVARGGPPDPEGGAAPGRGARELGKVADTELREAMAKAAARNLGWQEAEAGARPRNAPPPHQSAAAPAPRVPPPAPRGAAQPPPAPHGAARAAQPPAPRASRLSPEAAAPRDARRRRGGYFAATRRSRPSIRCIRNRSVGPNDGAIRRRSSR